MKSPVTSADFDPLANTASVCEAFRLKLNNNGKIASLLEYLFTEDGSLNPDFAVEFVDLLQPIGAIQVFAVDTGLDTAVWLKCDGSTVSRTGYAALFAKIGTAFGSGDGSTTFALPNLSDRMPVGVSNNKSLGATGGAETHTLVAGEIPAHSHDFKLWRESDASGGGVWIETAVDKSTDLNATLQTEAYGGGAAHNNMPPYVALGFYIKAAHKLGNTVLA